MPQMCVQSLIKIECTVSELQAVKVFHGFKMRFRAQNSQKRHLLKWAIECYPMFPKGLKTHIVHENYEKSRKPEYVRGLWTSITLFLHG